MQNTQNTHSHNGSDNLVSTPVDPNEAGWQEVKDLGIDAEPAGMIADDVDTDTVEQ